MFRKKVKEDPTELELLKIRVRNLEKQITEIKKAPQVEAEELAEKALLKQLELLQKRVITCDDSYLSEITKAMCELSERFLVQVH